MLTQKIVSRGNNGHGSPDANPARIAKSATGLQTSGALALCSLTHAQLLH